MWMSISRSTERSGRPAQTETGLGIRKPHDFESKLEEFLCIQVIGEFAHFYKTRKVC